MSGREARETWERITASASSSRYLTDDDAVAIIAAALDARVEACADVVEGFADQFDALAKQFVAVNGIGGETMHGVLTDQACLFRNVAEAIREAFPKEGPARGSSDDPKEG